MGNEKRIIEKIRGDVMENSDYIMVSDFNRTRWFFEKNFKRINILRSKLRKLDNDESYSNLQYIIEDLKYYSDTFNYYNISCNSLSGTRASFFSITTFLRANLETTYIIWGKIRNEIKENSDNKNISKIKLEVDKINKNLARNKNFRNMLEHNIDPYYSGDYYYLKKMFPLDMQLIFCEKALIICKLLRNYDLLASNKSININYKSIPIIDRKKIITNNSVKNNEVFRYTCELSYRVEKRMKRMEYKAFQLMDEGCSEEYISDELIKMKTPVKESNIIDLCFKLIELNKAILHSINYESKELILFNSPCAYFNRIAMNKCYQLCDKLGLYMVENNEGSNQTYFKKVCQDLQVKGDVLDEIKIQMVELKRKDYYIQLSKLRNFIEHNKGVIDFENKKEVISSVLISVYQDLTLIVHSLVTKYFCYNNIELSERSFVEALNKSNIYPI